MCLAENEAQQHMVAYLVNNKIYNNCNVGMKRKTYLSIPPPQMEICIYRLTEIDMYILQCQQDERKSRFDSSRHPTLSGEKCSKIFLMTLAVILGLITVTLSSKYISPYVSGVIFLLLQKIYSFSSHILLIVINVGHWCRQIFPI